MEKIILYGFSTGIRQTLQFFIAYSWFVETILIGLSLFKVNLAFKFSLTDPNN